MKKTKFNFNIKFLSSFSLKCIACLSMVSDHIGIVFFPQYEIFRMLGKIAFPIFCFLLVEGLNHTRDVKKYLLRLLLFAFVSEIPYDLGISGKAINFNEQNVFFTLFFGLLLMAVFKEKMHFILKILITIAVCAVVYFMNCDYNLFGIALILIYFGAGKMKHIFGALWHPALWIWEMGFSCQYFGVFATPLLLCYNGERGRKAKYLFYIFYPAHLLVIYIVSLIIKL